jgi:hypothetical protein
MHARVRGVAPGGAAATCANRLGAPDEPASNAVLTNPG